MDDKTKERSDKLFKLGLKWDGNYFTYPKQGINFHWTDLTCMSDEKFNSTLSKVESIIEEDKRAAGV